MKNAKKIRGFLSKTISGFTIFNIILAQVLLAGVFVFNTPQALAAATKVI